MIILSMNNKFPGFTEITPEHARRIQYDIQLYIHCPLNRYFGGCLPSTSAFSVEDRRRECEKDSNWERNYWAAVSRHRPRAWYIKIDDDKPEYSPTTTTDTQHQ